MNLSAMFGVVKADPAARDLFVTLLGEVVRHPVVAADLEAVEQGTMTPIAFLEKDEAVFLTVLGQVDAAFEADASLLPSILAATT